MTSSKPLTALRQNDVADVVAANMSGLSAPALNEYMGFQAFADAVKLVNGSTAETLPGLKRSLVDTHWLSGLGAVGTILSVALVRSLGHDAEVIARQGDFFVSLNGGAVKEQKFSFRDVRPSALRDRTPQMSMAFSPAQLKAASPPMVAWIGYEAIAPQEARVTYLHVPTVKVSALEAASSYRDGRFTLAVPVSARSGRFLTRGRTGNALQAGVHRDADSYRTALISE